MLVVILILILFVGVIEVRVIDVLSFVNRVCVVICVFRMVCLFRGIC